MHLPRVSMYIYIYTYSYIHICVYSIYIWIYIHITKKNEPIKPNLEKSESVAAQQEPQAPWLAIASRVFHWSHSSEFSTEQVGVSINGNTPKQMVYFMENPNLKWMRTEGIPMETPLGGPAQPSLYGCKILPLGKILRQLGLEQTHLAPEMEQFNLQWDDDWIILNLTYSNTYSSVIAQ